MTSVLSKFQAIFVGKMLEIRNLIGHLCLKSTRLKFYHLYMTPFCKIYNFKQPFYAVYFNRKGYFSLLDHTVWSLSYFICTLILRLLDFQLFARSSKCLRILRVWNLAARSNWGAILRRECQHRGWVCSNDMFAYWFYVI